jgi:AraC-like DNA-binding protein
MCPRANASRVRSSQTAALNGLASTRSTDPCRVLLVEPDLGLLASLAVALGPGVDLDQAVTVTDVLERVVDTPPHLVILNAAIPGLDAISVVKALRAQRPGCCVLAIADQPHASRVAELATLPLDGLLWKPLSMAKLLAHVTTLLRGRYRPRADRSLTRLSATVSRCMDYLSHHFGDALTLRSIGSTVGVSPSHLGHRFRAETGLTVKAYLARIRVAAARHLLTRTELKLETIAELVGFCDASHLSRVFRHLSGHRPGEYRRRSQRDGPAPLLRAPEAARALDGRDSRR